MQPKLKETRTVSARTYEALKCVYLHFWITGATMLALAFTLESVLPKGQGAGLGVGIALLISCAIPSSLILYFRWKNFKWRHDNPEAYKAKKAMQEAALVTAQNAPPGPIKTYIIGILDGIGGLLKVALIIAACCLILYVAYLIIISIPVSVAVIIGAIIIGLCILAAK